MSTLQARLLLLILVHFSFYISPAQTIPPKLADRMAAVENSLLPYVPVEGLPGWNIRDRMRLHKVPGLSIAVIRNYQIDWVKSYGLADTVAQKPVTNETIFSAGSISKLVTAMAVLKLVEQGKLNLDAPINTYLRSWTLADNDYTRQTPVTLRLLLSHRAGTSQSSYFGFAPDRIGLPSVVEVLSGASNAESRRVVVNGEVRKGFRYSGGGYMVVQMALMDVTGQDFATLTDQLLFKPLGLKHTTFEQPLPPRLALYLSGGYSPNGWYKGKPYVYPQQAAAGLHTTAAELARLVIDLQNSYRGKGGLLNAASVRTMVQPLAVVSEGFIREEIGLGAFLLQRATNAREEGRYFNHLGLNAGFVADATGSLVGGNGVVVMLNDNNGAIELSKEIRRAVAKVYGWPNFLPTLLKPAPLPDSLLDAYVGRFQRGPDEVVSFRREGRWLVETINNGNPIIAVPTGRDTLSLTDYTAQLYVSRGTTGRADSVRLEWNKQAWPRLPDGKLLPNELIRLGRISEAMEGYRAMNLNVDQLTYLAYEFAQNRPNNLPAAEGILELAKTQFPKSSQVYDRLGDLYELRGETARAKAAFEQAVALDPFDGYAKEKLKGLSR